MRVLQLHNHYRQPGGEDAVVRAEAALLRSHGHTVDQLTVDNRGVTGAGWIVPAVRAGSNPAGAALVQRHVARCRPDIVHVHNFFPLLTTAVYEPCAAADIPVVQTLHNYRPICPGATLFRNGRPCESCVDAGPLAGVLHRCYRGSLLGSAAAALMVASNARRNVWETSVDRFIVLSAFMKQKFEDAGFPSGRLMIKPNFADGGWTSAPWPGPRRGGLFIGRLSEEKGIRTLLDAAVRSGARVTLAGDGPLAAQCRASGLVMAGHVGATEAQKLAAEASYLVVPSHCYEGFPVVIAEAFASGLPVIASRIGALAEIVEHGHTGLLVTPGDAAELAATLSWASQHPLELEHMGRNARAAYEAKFSPSTNYRHLMRVYREALDDPSPARQRHARPLR